MSLLTVARRLLLVTAIAAVGSALAAPAAHAAPARTAAVLTFDVSGSWTDNGTAKPRITVAGNSVGIDMSYAHRPAAAGVVLDPATILITFPDSGTYLGTVLSPTLLLWSNGSTWSKVFTGPLVIDPEGGWVGDRLDLPVVETDGYLRIDMRSGAHRPNAVGYATSATTFRVFFPDDPGTTSGTLVADPDRIIWSNGSSWKRAEGSPGNPQCLLILC